jgi:filamentous hemagglutinin
LRADGGINCVKCSIAVDSTLAGRPAQALEGLASADFPGAVKILEEYSGSKVRTMSSAAQIEKVMSGAGTGSRGIVIGYKEGSEFSHAFNVVNQNGTIRFLDGQIGGAAKKIDQYDYWWFFKTNQGK